MPYVNNKGADQPVHLHNLISTFDVCFLDSISLVSIFAISGLLACFCSRAEWFKSYLVANPKDRFCHGSVHLVSYGRFTLFYTLVFSFMDTKRKLKLPEVFFLVAYYYQPHQEMSRLVPKPTKCLCDQQRFRSAWASAQSDQSLRYVLSGYPSFPHVDSEDCSDWANA